MAPRQIDTNKHHSLAKVHRTHPTVYPLSVILAAAVFSDSESEDSSCKVVVGEGGAEHPDCGPAGDNTDISSLSYMLFGGGLAAKD